MRIINNSGENTYIAMEPQFYINGTGYAGSACPAMASGTTCIKAQAYGGEAGDSRISLRNTYASWNYATPYIYLTGLGPNYFVTFNITSVNGAGITTLGDWNAPETGPELYINFTGEIGNP